MIGSRRPKAARHAHARLAGVGPRVLVAVVAATLAAIGSPRADAAARGTIQFIFTADVHYGITRAEFRGAHDARAHDVDAAMVAQMNALPAASFPKDGGLAGGQAVGGVDFVVVGGDIANREEVTAARAIQSASASWREFSTDFIEGLTTRDAAGRKSALYMVPGNHDVSNAIGFVKPMSPATDSTSMVEIFNRMMMPSRPRTAATYDYRVDKVLTSRDVGGIHLEFLNVWPDSAGRAWMAADLGRLPPTTPVIVFTHDEPDAEGKHFTNPNGRHDINGIDAFENLLVDRFADGSRPSAPTIEQRALEAFLRAHPNVSAYFHGNSNWNQFYDWTGPDHTIALHTFRVDSPMKGAVSGADETKLSFQVATLDPSSRTMTVRECLWNADPENPRHPLRWGASVTVALAPRPTASAQHAAGASRPR